MDGVPQCVQQTPMIKNQDELTTGTLHTAFVFWLSSLKVAAKLQVEAEEQRTGTLQVKIPLWGKAFLFAAITLPKQEKKLSGTDL